MISKIDFYVIERVKQIRRERKISQFDLAHGIGVTSGFIGKVESSNTSSRYNLQHINEIAKFLKISPQDLLPKEPL
jgi:transcriptional regulator with XRE-family HTH domain